MNKFKKKILLRLEKITVFSLLISTLIVGCGGEGASAKSGDSALPDPSYTVDPNTPAWQLDKREDTTLSWYINADWWDTDYGNDVITRQLIKDLHLTIEFSKGDNTKLNTLFASGEIPDIITTFDSASELVRSADRWAYSLNDLADKYDPYFYKVIAQQSFDWFQLDNGKTYSYPSYSNDNAAYESGFLVGIDAFIVREDIYNALGRPSMSTPEEFIDVLVQVHEQYPDLLPFGFRSFAGGGTGSLGVIFQNHLGVPIETTDGKWNDRNLDSDYLEWIRTFNHAYNQGLISSDTISDDNISFEGKVSDGRYFSMFTSGIPQLSSSLRKNYSLDPARKYIAIDGPKGASGREPTLNQTGISGWTQTTVSNTVKDPAKAIELFTYLLSKTGQTLTTYGVEGETYFVNDEGRFDLLPEITQLKVDNPDKYKKEIRLGDFWMFGNDLFKFEVGDNSTNENNDPERKDIVSWTRGKLKPQFLIERISPEPGTAEARNLVNINKTWDTTLAEMILADNDATFDAKLDDYKAFLEENNFDAITAIHEEKMDANRQRLGL